MGDANEAVIVAALFNVTAQVFALGAGQLLQPVNRFAGAAVSVTTVPAWYDAEHVAPHAIGPEFELTEPRAAPGPEVPTVSESGIPGYESSTWYGFIAPARTPRPILEHMARALQQASEEKETRDKFAARLRLTRFTA